MSPRLGDYRLTAELARDPFGSLHRAVRVEGGAFGRHALVRRFEPALLTAGLGARLGETVAHSLRLGEARGLAPHCRIYPRAEEPWVAYDLTPGLSLADLLGACRAQDLPLGLDQVLTVLRDVAGALAHLHGRGLSHGLLVPSLVWVGYDGAVTLLDVPVAPLLRDLVRPPYPPGLETLALAPGAGAARDLHLLACLGWQMLTLAPGLPVAPGALEAGLEDWSRQTGSPLPPALAADLRALEAERQASWAPGPPAAVPPPAPAATPLPRRGRGRLLGAAAAALLAVAGGIALARQQGGREAEGLRQALAEAQRHQAEVEQVRADLDARVAQAAERKRDLERELAQARDAARLEALARAWEEARRREGELQARQAQAKVRAEAAEAQARRLQAKAAGPAALPAPPAPPVPPVPPSAPRPAPEEGGPRVLVAAPLRHPGPRPEGRLRLRVFVDERGRALRATVVDGPAGPVSEAAVAAALASTYQPARREGQAVRGWTEVGY